MSLQYDPVFSLDEENKLFSKMDNFLLLVCVAFENRSITSVKKLGNIDGLKLNIIPVSINDDECTFLPWKKECEIKTKENIKELQKLESKIESVKLEDLSSFSLKKRGEDILRLKKYLDSIIDKFFQKEKNVKIIFDITCWPSYFAMQLIKYLVEKEIIDELLILYTKPNSYPIDEPLKTSPDDKSKPNFLPGYGDLKTEAKWIVGLGFDYDSVKNANRITEIIRFTDIKPVIPFPGYKPDYIIRCMKENKLIIKNSKKVYFTPADSPYCSYRLIKSLAKPEDSVILSSFGPKPIAIGFCLAAIEMKAPILHVQATNYNPYFSFGEGESLIYSIKYNKKIWHRNHA